MSKRLMEGVDCRTCRKPARLRPPAMQSSEHNIATSTAPTAAGPTATASRDRRYGHTTATLTGSAAGCPVVLNVPTITNPGGLGAVQRRDTRKALSLMLRRPLQARSIQLELPRFQLMLPACSTEFHPTVWARGLDAMTFPSALTLAHMRIEPPMPWAANFAGLTDPFASLVAVTAPLRSCRVPTLLSGRLMPA